MIKLNQLSKHIKEKYSISCQELLGNPNELLGGIYSNTVNKTSEKLAELFKKNVILTSSGTNAILISLEYAIMLAKNKKILFYLSEYSYFTTVSYFIFKKNMGFEIRLLKSNSDEVTINEVVNFEENCFYIFMFTSHNNINCNIDQVVSKIPKEFRFIVEDRCLTFGINHSSVSDSECYSFSNNKFIIAGEGGCLSSNNNNFIQWAKLRTFSGIHPYKNVPQFMYTGYYKVNPHESPFKCSISAVNALLILEQLNFIENIKQKRIKNYQTLKEELPTILESIPDSPLFFSLNFNRKMTVKTLRKIQFEFLRQGIQTHLGVLSFDFFTKPIAYKYVLSLPCHTELNEDQIVHITHTTKKILKQNEI